MQTYLISSHFDLVTPDGQIKSLKKIDKKTIRAVVVIKNISPAFLGFTLSKEELFFNLKSTLAQIGINSSTISIYLNKTKKEAEVEVDLLSISPLGQKFLGLISEEIYVGKLFAIDRSRKVREPNYLMRMFGRTDRDGLPLLFLGAPGGKDELILEKVKGYTIAFLPLQNGVITYSEEIYSFLPTLAKLLKHKKFKIRELVKIHQKWNKNSPRIAKEGEVLLVKTAPLHIRTVFAKVAKDLLPAGFQHTSACILQPDTTASGNIYELYGSSQNEITDIPLEFYTLEPHREHVFFEDRDQLQIYLEDPKTLFEAFETSPNSKDDLSSVFIVKGTQLKTLSKNDWIRREVYKHEFPGLNHPARQAILVEKYIKQQPSYPFLKAIEEGVITSQGILLTKFFPSPLMKKMLLSRQVQRSLKAIYFQKPSRSSDIFFSHEDRGFLHDLAKFAIPVYWVDEISEKILKYIVRPDKDAGMFVPLNLIETFRKATFFGVYGSNLIEGNFEDELKKLLLKLLTMQTSLNHPLLSKNTPIALVTGGGPGAMEVGNRVAKKVGILSCANIVDFRKREKSVINEQKTNPYIDAKMTYRLDRLVERQAEFHLDFPICLQGGIGMDFEFTLEEVRRKVGAVLPTPILLFGDHEYWKDKITSRFQRNKVSGTIKGSEWISNCFYCVKRAEQAERVYKDFFEGRLPIGENGPVYEDGFKYIEDS